MTLTCVSCSTRPALTAENMDNYKLLSKKETAALIADVALPIIFLLAAFLIVLVNKGVNLGPVSSIGALGMHSAYALIGLAGAISVTALIRLLILMAKHTNQLLELNKTLRNTPPGSTQTNVDQKELEETKAELEQANKNAKNLAEQLDEKVKELTTATAETEANKTKAQGLEIKNTKLESDIDALKLSNSELQKNLDAFKSADQTSLQSRITLLTEEKEELNKKIRLNDQITVLENLIVEKENAHTRKQNELGKVEQQLKTLQETNEELVQKMNEGLEQKKAELDNLIIEKEKALTGKQNELETVEQQLKTFQETNQERAKNMSEALVKKQAELDQANKELDEKQKSLAQLKQDINDIQTLQANLENTKKELEATKKTLSDREAQLNLTRPTETKSSSEDDLVASAHKKNTPTLVSQSAQDSSTTPKPPVELDTDKKRPLPTPPPRADKPASEPTTTTTDTSSQLSRAEMLKIEAEELRKANKEAIETALKFPLKTPLRAGQLNSLELKQLLPFAKQLNDMNIVYQTLNTLAVSIKTLVQEIQELDETHKQNKISELQNKCTEMTNHLNAIDSDENITLDISLLFSIKG